MNRKQTYKFGLFAEKISMILLWIKGYKILEWRYKTYFGEIDIIAKKSCMIVVIEVKARSSKFLVEEVLYPKQIERIKKAAEFFIVKNSQFQNYDLRFDFIEFEGFFTVRHHKNFIS
jgi:putative endonuclease